MNDFIDHKTVTYLFSLFLLSNFFSTSLKTCTSTQTGIRLYWGHQLFFFSSFCKFVYWKNADDDSGCVSICTSFCLSIYLLLCSHSLTGVLWLDEWQRCSLSLLRLESCCWLREVQADSWGMSEKTDYMLNNSMDIL